jgi:hypothetical protein
MRWLIIAVLLAGCGPSANPDDVPPEGEIWFGSTFDTETFELSGRTKEVSTTEVFALVGTLPRSVNASELVIRSVWEGQQVASEPANASGSGEVWGFTYGPLVSPGEWTIEFTDIGGNVLASGTLTATE